MPEPLVSVIIPCYNAARFVKEAVDSIRYQTYKNLEIILIDDESSDNTYQLLKTFAHQDDRIRVVRNEQNLKLIKTLNKALSFATGRYIARMDADDVSRPDRIEKQVRFMEENPDIDLVSSFTRFITEQSRPHSRYSHFCCTTHGALKFMALFESPFLHAGLVARKEIFLANRFRDSEETLHIEDYELWTRMFLQNIRFHALPEYLYLYRRNSVSVSFRFRELQWKNHIQNSENFIQQLLQENVVKGLHRVILTRSPKYEAPIAGVFRYFDTFVHTFRKLHVLSEQEISEIMLWTQQRKIRIILYYVTRASLGLKLSAFVAFLKLIPELSWKRTLQNFYAKGQWAYSDFLLKTGLMG